MPNASDNNAVLRENLCDAGFSKAKIEDIMAMLSDNNKQALDALLTQHRRNLLGKVRLYTQQLDCLDYFTYTLKKQTEVK
ncbi:MAG: hypothetical protein IJP94_06750 [Clostridia bacterium]|nr:hypothetical protein [Ruminococcus sp.]MBQ7503958.1 hypothetical protein [Ruminococcus sp.]MBR0089519.1 hypothetical protein [Clostridia bacterium]